MTISKVLGRSAPVLTGVGCFGLFKTEVGKKILNFHSRECSSENSRGTKINTSSIKIESDQNKIRDKQAFNLMEEEIKMHLQKEAENRQENINRTLRCVRILNLKTQRPVEFFADSMINMVIEVRKKIFQLDQQSDNTVQIFDESLLNLSESEIELYWSIQRSQILNQLKQDKISLTLLLHHSSARKIKKILPVVNKYHSSIRVKLLTEKLFEFHNQVVLFGNEHEVRTALEEIVLLLGDYTFRNEAKLVI